MREVASIVAIYVAPSAAAAMVGVSSVEALPGEGLAGDRYAKCGGTFSSRPLDHELTLIEEEVAADVRNATGVDIPSSDFRRNLITRGIRLNDLEGREFWIGAVRCRGTRLCHPCALLQKRLGVAGLVESLTNRGGLRAVILGGGMIRVGDEIRGAGAEERCG